MQIVPRYRLSHPLDDRMCKRALKIPILSFLLACIGCANPGPFHKKMEISARPQPGIRQTQLAHIGQIITVEGTFQVATQRRILTDMLAPRGLTTRLLIFTSAGDLVSYFDAAFHTGGEPLWCEGDRVYLLGFSLWNIGDTLQPVDADPRLEAHRGKFRSGSPFPDSITGNVLDFSRGPTRPLLTRETRYGSSGGIEDDAWELKPEAKEN